MACALRNALNNILFTIGQPINAILVLKDVDYAVQLLFALTVTQITSLTMMGNNVSERNSHYSCTAMSPGIIEIVLLQYARNVCLYAKNVVQEINVNNAFQDSS
jgi:hypothetical protein